MRAHPSTVLAVLLALALGYLVGADRRGAAEASPVYLERENGSYLTHDETGSTLTVWSMSNGRPVRATEYSKGTGQDPDGRGGSAETQVLRERVYPLVGQPPK